MHDDEAGHEDRVAAVVKVPVKWIYPAALRIHKGATHNVLKWLSRHVTAGTSRAARPPAPPVVHDADPDEHPSH